MNTCQHCTALTINPKFCTKSCAAKFNNKLRTPRTVDSKKKTSDSMQRLRKAGFKNTVPETPSHAPRTRIYFQVCKVCKSSFISKKIKRLTCSKVCYDSIRSQNGTLKQRITYNNMVFQSAWEIDIAKFLDLINITWEQPHKRILWYDTTLQKERTYLPDFYLVAYNIYIDVKNPFKQAQDCDKLQQLKSIIPLFVGNIPEVKNYVARLAGLEPACVL